MDQGERDVAVFGRREPEAAGDVGDIGPRVDLGLVHHAVGPKEGHGGVEHADLEGLALTGDRPLVKGGRDRLGCGPRRGLVHDAVADQSRLACLAIGLLGGIPGEGLDDVVVGRTSGVGTIGPEPVDGDMDEPWSARTGVLGIEPEALGDRPAKVVDDDVAPVEQRVDHRTSLGSPQVEGQRALGPVEIGEVGRHFADADAEMPDGIATCGRLDLDDIGTLIAQHHRGQRSGHVGGEVDDADARERQARRHCRSRARSWRAITIRWISFVPSPMHSSGASR